jgi:hypothetical protein
LRAVTLSGAGTPTSPAGVEEPFQVRRPTSRGRDGGYSAGLRAHLTSFFHHVKLLWWHQTTIEKLVERSVDTALGAGEKSLYKTFYKEASSLAHGDSYVVLRHRTGKGWFQVFDPNEQENCAVEALSLTYEFFASMLFQVQIRFKMELEQLFNKMIPDLEQLPHEA